VAYNFGALFLSAPPPRGAGEPRKAVELLERGIAANPDSWRLWHQLGFIYYWELRDYSKAAAAYQEGAKNPSARPWMKVMAAVIQEKGGSRDTSLFLWKEIYNGTEDPTIRKNAIGHIQGLQAQMDMEEIEKQTQTFRNRTGRWPDSIQELVSNGLLQGIPTDAAGFPYRLLPGGKAALDPKTSVTLEYDNAPAPPIKPAAP
jgi:tetratricopeptide (TPR) repeat protein